MKTRINTSNRTRTLSMLATAGAALALTSAAGAQIDPFRPMGLGQGMLEVRATGISADGKTVVYKAIKEQGVQVYESPGHWADGEFFDMPDQFDENGDYVSSVSMQFRARPDRAEVIPGVDIIVKTKPGPKQAAVWDTREGMPGAVIDLSNPFGAASAAHAANADASIIGGTLFGDLDGQGESRHAVAWRPGGCVLRPTLPGTRASEVWGVSLDGEVAVGGISDQPMPEIDGEHLTHALGAIWKGDHLFTVEPAAFGYEAVSVVFTGVSDDGGACYATISSTRSNAKGGLYFDSTGEAVILDGGDINGDGQINILDDHDSAIGGVSADARIVGGSITLPGGLQTAAVWTLTDQGIYTEQGLQTLLANLGSTGQDGWDLRAITGVSADGRTVAGWGVNPQGLTEGFVAKIPAPGPAFLLGLAVLAATNRRRA